MSTQPAETRQRAALARWLPPTAWVTATTRRGCRFAVRGTLLLGLCSTFPACSNLGYPRPGPECSDMPLPSLPDSAPRLHFEAFSMLPPQGPNWCMLLDQGKGGMFLKNPFGGRYLDKPPSERETRNTLVAMVRMGTPPGPIDSIGDLERMANETLTEQTNGIAQGTVLQRKVAREERITDALCIRLDETREGRLSRTQPGQTFVITVTELTCKHPTRPLLIGIGYSERYLKALPPEQPLVQRYRHELEPFLGSLQFAR